MYIYIGGTVSFYFLEGGNRMKKRLFKRFSCVVATVIASLTLSITASAASSNAQMGNFVQHEAAVSVASDIMQNKPEGAVMTPSMDEWETIKDWLKTADPMFSGSNNYELWTNVRVLEGDENIFIVKLSPMMSIDWRDEYHLTWWILESPSDVVIY